MTISFNNLSGINLAQPLRLNVVEGVLANPDDQEGTKTNLENLRGLCVPHDQNRSANMTQVNDAISELGNLEKQGFGADQINFKKAEPHMGYKSFEYEPNAKTDGNPRAIMNHLLEPFGAQLEHIKFANLLELALAATRSRIDALNERLIEPLLQAIRSNTKASEELRNKLIAAVQTMYADLQGEGHAISLDSQPTMGIELVK